ncbi:trans-sulfuration enzyme family protein [Rhodohalobacter mucosus]|uniref:Methionine gamma-lyase n=1 Tax=Rhodohalobacter mucosus TaxID=2079485 RepID=A0A316U3Q4_9BACT|nr:PLP-dependent aspartate aminotransferase family protein [Rhodohalobacter mucosus]PWN08116.1 methionine gamma-lyase [Rhodohalobacter mucosus]
MESKKTEYRAIETICAQADHPDKDPYGSHAMPLYQTSTFAFKDAESGRKFFAHEPGGATHSYSRLGNPTVEKAEQVIADLEGLDLEERTEGMLFGSGMAAITTAFLALASGKRILAQKALYGCTSQFLQEQAGKMNIRVQNVDPNTPDDIIQAFKKYKDIGLVYLESIANPTMRVCNLELISEIAHEHGALVMVDNTFATPYHIRPMSWGADLVAHSTTKYLNGHGTVVGGALAARKGFFEKHGIPVYRKNLGGISGPFDAWLTLMGIKTFPLRMKQHNLNGKAVADYLDRHPAVSRIWHTGLETHPDGEIIEKLMVNGYGAMIAFELKGGLDAGIQLMNRVELCTLAVSLGTVDSLIQHPASMTHSVVDPVIRGEAGITDGLVRLSVGIENASDIIADLNRALSSIKYQKSVASDPENQESRLASAE